MTHFEKGLVLVTVASAFFPAIARAAAPRAVGITAPLPDEEAWTLLPRAATGSGKPLPTWSRMIVRSLPRTTAALLELDFAQRTRSPLAPRLRAAMRYVAARANHSEYGQAVALADARRAGLGGPEIDALTRGERSGFSDPEKAALEFAKKMTVASSAVTDDEFAYLAKEFGDKKVAAMVLLMAYANFQDRLLICLGAPVEKDGPLPPLEVVFQPEALASRSNPPAPPTIADLPRPTGKDLVEDDADWKALTYDQLQEKLEAQRAKPTRLRVPTWEEVKRGLPEGRDMQGKRVVWSLVAFGYVPELAAPWENLMWINGEENGRRFDRVFGLSLFWVVTRAIDCPYCMGHCEMNWEVIGMTPSQVAERSRALASDDWSSFPPAEQRALAFARTLTRSPGAITRKAIDGLEKDFGPEAALSMLLYACRCNYMVRVSNGFQLSLERDNVFYDYYKKMAPTPSQPGDGTSRR